ncbi:hypothetical protein [Tabrizicola sp.]|uniref:hypothetical protein n=1 Tax=Tabrizicola sp. TaxID=2005166 RepID=UPI003F39C762
MRHLAASLIALALASPALAEIDISASIGEKGIAATLTTLESLSRPHTDAESFAIGGLHFLSAIETALQTQWRTGGTSAITNVMSVPVLRLPVPPNPLPEPFSGAIISKLFADVDAGMGKARSTLTTMPPDADFALDIAFDDLWFDINMNGTRDAKEDAGAILGPQLMGWRWSDRDPSAPLPVIRFDGADAAWLLAYTHLLSGVSNSILTYDPAAAIDEVIATRTALGIVPENDNWIGPYIDEAVAVGEALRQTPNAERSKAAKAHFLQMIAENRRFWAMVAKETDNDREWIPNDKQTSALGLTLPPGTGDMWLAVLADAEALLQGRLLIPFGRGAAGQGINLGKLFDDPQPGSLIGWFQGSAALPYLEKGPVVSDQNLRAFEQMMTGNSGLMMVFLN